MSTKPFTAVINDTITGKSRTIELDTQPVPEALNDLVGDCLSWFETIVRDPTVPPLDQATIPDYSSVRICATGGALLAKHCAKHLRDYVRQADAQNAITLEAFAKVRHKTDLDQPAKTHAFTVWLESPMQIGRLESALLAYRTMRLETDAMRTCERVLMMMEYLASEAERA